VKTIRALRQERGWTQFELALKVGVQPQAVYFWESGRRTPQVPQLRRLGKIFGMCSDEIDLAPLRPLTSESGESRDDRAGAVVSGRDAHGRAPDGNNKSPLVSND
jgi:transcriptional regulator with XRE-family HTH domain